MMEETLQFLAMWSGPGLVLGSLFFADSLVLSASILSVQGVWSPTEIFTYVLIGTVIKDAIWFIGGRKAFSFVERWEHVYEGLERIERHTERIVQHPLLVLLVYKLIYGIRTATILFLSRSSSVRLWQFILFNAIGSAIWLGVVISVGRLAGQGIVNFIPALENAQMMLGAIVLAFILIGVARSVYRKTKKDPA